MSNTRFNPTVNGNLHLGHAYTLLVNYHIAKDSGGKFFIRFDDTSQAICIEMEHKERIPAIIENQKKDINWLGISVDMWQTQSDFLDEVHEILDGYDYPKFRDSHPHYLPVSIKMPKTWLPYPYTPLQTAERVIMDWMLGITHIIRGEEFLTEYGLYYFYCDVFNKPKPEFTSLPRLVGIDGEDISKTMGGYKLADLRASGWSASDVIKLLQKSCLCWPCNGWNLHNLKQSPRINL